MVPYLNALFDGDIYDLADGTVYQSAQAVPQDLENFLAIWPKKGQEEVNRATRRKAKKCLEQMSGMVEFEVRTL